MAFILPELPYDKKALHPFISEETFEFHHGKHHAAYVNNLNAAVKDTDYEGIKLEDAIIRSAKENKLPVFNNGAQHWNHTFFWECMTPNGGGTPKGKIAELINSNFGSFDAFKDQFSKAATTLFGAGWAWLTSENDKLEIIALSNAGTPITLNKKALLTIDVWEHAYYIDYRNSRPKFIEGFWDVINWDKVNSRI